MISVEIENRSSLTVDEAGAVELAGRILRAEGIDDGELGIAFVGSDEMRRLKREHLGIDEATDVLSFPIDGRDKVPEGVPRALGDVVLCPEIVGDEWRWPLAHGLLHLLGYGHGDEMSSREAELLQ
jgi:probable rRNA maturation factor